MKCCETRSALLYAYCLFPDLDPGALMAASCDACRAELGNYVEFAFLRDLLVERRAGRPAGVVRAELHHERERANAWMAARAA